MPGKTKFELSVTQLVASAAATVTATVAASYFGVSGTIIGAGVVSVLSTVGAALYRHALDRGRRGIAARIPERAAAGRSGTAVAHEAGGVGDTVVDGLPVAGGRLPWPKWYVLAGGAAGIFLVVMGLVTAFELFTGGPLARVVQGKAGQGTSVHPGTTGLSPTTQPPGSDSAAPATPTAQPPGSDGATPTAPPAQAPTERPQQTTPTPSPGGTSQSSPGRQPSSTGTPTGPTGIRSPALQQPPPLGEGRANPGGPNTTANQP